MKRRWLLLVLLVPGACNPRPSTQAEEPHSSDSDSLRLVEMISIRERAMVDRDISTAMAQFSEDATWINSQGYFFEGRHNILEFHRMLAGRDSVDYRYEAGTPRIRVIDADNAIVYYSWKMFWYDSAQPADTTYREIGLMTLTAQKRSGDWKWIAVTNQHTPWFYEEVEAVTVE